MKTLIVVVVALALSCGSSSADVKHLRGARQRAATTRLQRLESAPTPYPAAGYRPHTQFDIPTPDTAASGSDGNGFEAPEQLYAAPPQPARLRQQRPSSGNRGAQFARQQQPQATYLAPQRTYGAPQAEPQAERFTALKSSRLTANREDREEDDDQESTDEIEVNATEEVEAPKPLAKTPTAAPPATPTITYFPAGAVSFVHPLAAYVQQPAVAGSAKLIAPAAASSVVAAPQYYTPYAQYATFAAPLRAW